MGGSVVDFKATMVCSCDVTNKVQIFGNGLIVDVVSDSTCSPASSCKFNRSLTVVPFIKSTLIQSSTGLQYITL